MGRIEQAVAAVAVIFALAGCAVSGAPTPAADLHGLRYVALGDSFTIGTSVLPAERFPDQLSGGMQQRVSCSKPTRG